MSIFVGNIPEIVDREVLLEEFSAFGDMKLSYFGRFAYIDYTSFQAARLALLAWNGRIMAGHVLNIEYHFEQPEEVSNPIEEKIEESLAENTRIPDFSSLKDCPILPRYEFQDAHPDPGSHSSSPKARPKSSKSKHFRQSIGDALIEENPTMFTLKRQSKRKPENSLIFCEICQKDFKKKYIKDHIKSKSHSSNLSKLL